MSLNINKLNTVNNCTFTSSVVKKDSEKPKIQTCSRMDCLPYTEHYYKPIKEAKPIFKIYQSPPYSTFTREVNEIPDINKLDKSAGWLFDVRGADISNLDLSKQLELLRYADFDSKTVFPTGEKACKDFDSEKVLNTNKTPGLGVNKMHEKGYTGKGVRIAVIDQPLAVNHDEFNDKVIHYEEIGYDRKTEASMHGSAVTSILAGDTVGVAPDSELVYFAANIFDEKTGEKVNSNYCEALENILEMNEKLPPSKRIQVVSVSWGFAKDAPDYPKLQETLEKLEQSGVFVVSTALKNTHKLYINGANRDPQKDPDDPNSYSPGLFWSENADKEALAIRDMGIKPVLFPMDHRTTASPSGKSDYTHYPSGGMSWAIPYSAGLYAVAKQANPSITPQEFWEMAYETGSPIKAPNSLEVGHLANPDKLMEAIATGS